MSGGTVLPRHEQFIKERRYVNNVSPATIHWYEQSLCWLDTESPTSEDIRSLVMRLRERGLEPVSIKSRLQAVKAYCRWAGLTVVIPKMKVEERLLPTFDSAQVNRLMQWRPRTKAEYRLQSDHSYDVGRLRFNEGLDGNHSGPEVGFEEMPRQIS